MRGYSAWSLMDNLEWTMGYGERFGLFYVNRSDPSLPRIPKTSVWHYATIINCNGFIRPGESPLECQIHEPEGNIYPFVCSFIASFTLYVYLSVVLSLHPSIQLSLFLFTGTAPPSPSGEELLVSFLGLEVSGPDAALGLNVLFSLTIIAAVAVVGMAFGLVKTSKKQKHPVEEHINLENKF